MDGTGYTKSSVAQGGEWGLLDNGWEGTSGLQLVDQGMTRFLGGMRSGQRTSWPCPFGGSWRLYAVGVVVFVLLQHICYLRGCDLSRRWSLLHLLFHFPVVSVTCDLKV